MFFRIIEGLAVVLIITFVPGLPPYMNFDSYRLDLTPIESVVMNGELNNAEKLFLNEVKGPEDFAVYKNELYFSTHGGFVQKLFNGKLVKVVKFGKQCDGLWQEHICGRPLGLRFGKDGSLYVADAYFGIKKVNLTSGDIKTLVSIEVPIKEVVPRIPNSVDLHPSDNSLFWTDSSTTHSLHDGLFTFLGNGNGRLLKYNPVKNSSEVLLEGLFFPNGVAVSDDGTYLVVAETFKARLLRYNLKGSKAGQAEVFIDGLPGYPDNIQPDGKGGFIVSLIIIPSKFDKELTKWPLVRKFLARTLTLIDGALQELHKIYPVTFLEKAAHWVGHFESLYYLRPQTQIVIVVFLNKHGEIVKLLTSSDGNISSISSLVSFGGYYYLGSPFNPYLARVKVH